MKVLNKIEADFNNIVSNANNFINDLRIENFTEFKKLGIPTSKEAVSYTHLTLPTTPYV